MIICPDRGLVFIHIPKCAGSSVRSQVKLCDPSHRSLGDVGMHPELGKIDFGHIPLATLRVHFPQEYASVRHLVSVAIVRDPLERFGSALRQFLWRYENRAMTSVPKDELRSITLPLLNEIAACLDAPSYRLIFFARQVDFVFDSGTRMIDHILPMALVPDFIGYLGHRCGVALDTGARANQNVDLRIKSLGKAAYAVNDVLRRTLPGGWHERVKSTALSLLASGKSAAETSGVLDIPEVRDFVTEHYEEDAILYRAAVAAGPGMRQAMADDMLSPSFR